MPTWSAEVIVDERLVRRLLAQFPHLELRPVRPLSEGWDYAIWAVDDEWAFRFPRREIVLPGMELEIAIVPRLAPSLPVAVPAAVFVGEPAEEFRWRFFGSRLLPGRELGELSPDDAQRLEIGLQLASFLRALHSIELDAELPPDPNRRADMTIRVPKTREQLAELERLDVWRAPPEVDALLAEAEALPPSRHAAIVHGDLHFRQLLAGEGGRLTGVLDWVDLGRTDPAVDLCMLWAYVPLAHRLACLDAYGPVDDAQLLRARVVALSVWAALAHYGRVERRDATEREAVAGLDRILS